MKAEQARQLGNTIKVNKLIESAVLMEKTHVRIPKHLVDREQLIKDGYDVGTAHQQSDSVIVSWREVEDRRGG